jgi:hypothetical protein
MKKTVRFYSEEEKKEISRMVNDLNINVNDAAEAFGKKYNRSPNAVEVKIYKTRRKLNSNVIKQSPILQQSAEIGIEVPHGMTFEGKPKKIMLHSDHFRIYF